MMAVPERPDIEPEMEEENVDNGNPETGDVEKDEISASEDKENAHDDDSKEDCAVDSPSKDDIAIRITETVLEENDDKENNNLITIELLPKESERHSPEIVIEPKFSERLSNGKLTSHNNRVMTPKFYSLPSLRQQTPPPPSKKTSGSSLICLKSFKRCFLLILFSSVVVGYAIGGAYLFSHLERKRDIEYNVIVDRWKNDTAILLATELRQVLPYEEVWARKVFQYLEIFEKDLLKASAIGYRRLDQEDRGQRWTLTSSLHFSISLMTTTGYGPMTPRSNVGRTAAAFYSLVGIPLTISWLTVTGYTLATLWASLFRNVCCHLCHEGVDPDRKPRTNSIAPLGQQKLASDLQGSKLPPECTTNGDARIPAGSVRQVSGDVYHTMDYATAIVYASLLFVVYYMFFSILFAVQEGWMLTDVLYFSFLMFATLGPGCHEMEDDRSEMMMKNNILYTVHLCLGYCLLAMIANLFYLLFAGKRQSDEEPHSPRDT